MMGAPKIFTEEGVIKKEEIKNQVIVEGPGEVIKLDENERAALKLGPKFCMYNKLSDEEFEVDVEECILKIKWDLMGDENKPRRGSEDKALEVLLGVEEC